MDKIFTVVVYTVQVVDGVSEAEGGDGDCGEMVGYVDDGAYSYAHRKYSLLEEMIHGNQLVINPDKTHLMVMGTNRI